MATPAKSYGSLLKSLAVRAELCTPAAEDLFFDLRSTAQTSLSNTAIDAVLELKISRPPVGLQVTGIPKSRTARLHRRPQHRPQGRI